MEETLLPQFLSILTPFPLFLKKIEREHDKSYMLARVAWSEKRPYIYFYYSFTTS